MNDEQSLLELIPATVEYLDREPVNAERITRDPRDWKDSPNEQ